MCWANYVLSDFIIVVRTLFWKCSKPKWGQDIVWWRHFWSSAPLAAETVISPNRSQYNFNSRCNHLLKWNLALNRPLHAPSSQPEIITKSRRIWFGTWVLQTYINMHVYIHSRSRQHYSRYRLGVNPRINDCRPHLSGEKENKICEPPMHAMMGRGLTSVSQSMQKLRPWYRLPASDDAFLQENEN